ncbi:hypothetical protein K438DRAFT_1942917 [Mycena galopus ATCC 62051]|nr:hypothetical protein K438DRAFT_1942917 [Mycena galopus ATCC 62051]
MLSWVCSHSNWLLRLLLCRGPMYDRAARSQGGCVLTSCRHGLPTLLLECRRWQHFPFQDVEDQRRAPCPPRPVLTASPVLIIFISSMQGRQSLSSRYVSAVPLFARVGRMSQERFAVEKEEASFHMALMAREGTSAKAKARLVQAASSHVHRFFNKCARGYVPSHIGGRRTCSRPGPSPLCLSHTAPESVPGPSTALIHSACSTPVVPLSAPSPAPVPVSPVLSTAPLGAKGPAAIILAALGRGDDDRSLEYDDDEGDASSFISYDAVHGLWTRVELEHESIVHLTPSHPPVLVDARLRTLWRAGNDKERVPETPKRRPRSRVQRGEKENEGAERQVQHPARTS